MSSRCVRTWASLWLCSGIAASSRWQYTLCVGFICGVFALRSNLGFGSASQWHHSFFTLCCKPLSASQWHRSGIAASSRWQCKPRYGFAVASQWHLSVSTLAMRVSLQRRRGIAVSSRCKKQASLGIAVASQRIHAGNASLARLRYGIAVASKSLHAVNEGVASASQWHRSVFTLLL